MPGTDTTVTYHSIINLHSFSGIIQIQGVDRNNAEDKPEQITKKEKKNG